MVSALHSHGEVNAAVATTGFWAIAYLCLNNTANKTSLGQADACTGAKPYVILFVHARVFEAVFPKVTLGGLLRISILLL